MWQMYVVSLMIHNKLHTGVNTEQFAAHGRPLMRKVGWVAATGAHHNFVDLTRACSSSSCY